MVYVILVILMGVCAMILASFWKVIIALILIAFGIYFGHKIMNKLIQVDYGSVYKRILKNKFKYLVGFTICLLLGVSLLICSKPIKNHIEDTNDEGEYYKAIEYYIDGSYQSALSKLDNLEDSYRDTKIFKDAIKYEIEMDDYVKENGIIPEWDDIYIEYMPDVLEVEKVEIPQLHYEMSYQSYINATWELLARYERKVLKDNYIENPTILPCNGMSVDKIGLTNLGEPDVAVGTPFVDGEKVLYFSWKSNDNKVLAECLSYKHTMYQEGDGEVCRFRYYGEECGYDQNGIYIED